MIASGSSATKPTTTTTGTSTNHGHGHHQWIYGCETGCDVIFLVGGDTGEIWRLPAHTSILKSKNCLFEIMFSDKFLQSSSIDVPDVDGRAFDNLLRFLYDEPVSVQSVENALGTLYAGHKYGCDGLVRLCISYLLDNFKETNILLILKIIRVFSHDYQTNLENLKKEQQMQTMQSSNNNGNEIQGSAVGTASNIQEQSQALEQQSGDRKFPNLNTMPELQINSNVINNDIEAECFKLLQQCLKYIDHHAVPIITSDELEDLDLCTLNLILSRDTLDVGGDEGVVFTAISKWADKECKRKQLPLTGSSKRSLLQGALFLPRYLTMSLQSFQAGPGRSDLFTKEELFLLTELIKSTTANCAAATAAKEKHNRSSPTTNKRSITQLNILTVFSILPLIELSSSSITPWLQQISRVRAPPNKKNDKNGPINCTNLFKPSSSSSNSCSSSRCASPTKRFLSCKSFSFFKTLQYKTRAFCCRLTNSSNQNSPVVSLNSSPTHHASDGNNYNLIGQESEQVNNDASQKSVVSKGIFERIVVCLACFLD